MMKVQVVAVVIKDQNKFLLGKRSLSKKSAPGYWCPVSGKIEIGETEQEAVVREVFEEVNLVVVAKGKLGIFDTRDRSATIHWWLVDVVSGEPSLKNDEHSELRWFSISEMEIFENVFSEDIELFKTLV
ncbi:MAG: NUDIX domain-containing protein [Bdellovibrionales bacterium]|nr:NUDIX domain-containing protein [Bdellovibrionales bacterium]